MPNTEKQLWQRGTGANADRNEIGIGQPEIWSLGWKSKVHNCTTRWEMWKSNCPDPEKIWLTYQMLIWNTVKNMCMDLPEPSNSYRRKMYISIPKQFICKIIHNLDNKNDGDLLSLFHSSSRIGIYNVVIFCICVHSYYLYHLSKTGIIWIIIFCSEDWCCKRGRWKSRSG